jgi:predicted membrane channel-forming protein YqfA (hemolysin III family)
MPIVSSRETAAPPASIRRDEESPDERRNRQLIELLNELRVALPGVQMLFGFLLAVPFSQRFHNISSGQRHLYYITFLTTAAATACFIAPASFHRITWQRRQKQNLLNVSSGLAIIGTVFLAAAICGSVALVTSLLFGTSNAIWAGALAGGVLAGLWFALPLAFRLRSPGRSIT